MRTTARSCATAAVCLGAYFRAPLDGDFTARTVLVLLGGLVAIMLVVLHQTRTIVTSLHPRLRAAQALATIIPIYLLLFASAYCLMGNGDPRAYSEPLSRLDALYFTVTVFSSVGLGDIAPRTQLARALTTTQMLGDLVIIGLVVQALLGAARQGLERRNRHDG